MSIPITGYKVNGYDLNQYFPSCQYKFYDIYFTTSSGYIDISDYGTNLYYVFTSIESLDADISYINYLGHVTIYNRTNTNFQWFIDSARGLDYIIRIHFMIVYQYTLPDPLLISNYTCGDSSLSNFFPLCQFSSVQFTGKNGTRQGTVYITDYGTTNYNVLTSILALSSGSGGGTFSPSGLSQAINQILIVNKTNNSFEYFFTEATGDNINMELDFMIVYYTNNYNQNINYNINNTNIVKYFPICQFVYVTILNSPHQDLGGTINITNYGTTNYDVFTSVYYIAGDDTTTDLSNYLAKIIILEKTVTNFNWKTTIEYHELGAEANFTLYFTVVYSNL